MGQAWGNGCQAYCLWSWLFRIEHADGRKLFNDAIIAKDTIPVVPRLLPDIPVNDDLTCDMGLQNFVSQSSVSITP